MQSYGAGNGGLVNSLLSNSNPPIFFWSPTCSLHPKPTRAQVTSLSEIYAQHPRESQTFKDDSNRMQESKDCI